ncbi:hypothetical protein A3D70_00875 [Candidatus Adlerbacteria bacterium RIFCSPHIGHO2_02_FULL_54_18]|uniref:Uncharacterized protein n=2 Tax=Candidatus Adleribacteriota TaxID=1752736 RepID=A0A1F4Y1W4_9BACT|nr:MAG: hypothetical protein A2949_02850 [Candidatus Adlerbacteria bacterium RIFCSPLOWO2_01_FULL_54_21b]OGC87932.1 MAG: hypothetical protein A3D70_00875 [Candidatus Adlerbacteria bacterium RIFCSPHIGHO2_02_FULL_54_18]
MTASSRWIYAVTFLLAAAGFLLPFWPLTVVGIVLCALSGRWLFAVAVALLFDVAWGAPTGAGHFLLFPFTALALVAGLARLIGGHYFLDKSPQETL